MKSFWCKIEIHKWIRTDGKLICERCGKKEINIPATEPISHKKDDIYLIEVEGEYLDKLSVSDIFWINVPHLIFTPDILRAYKTRSLKKITRAATLLSMEFSEKGYENILVNIKKLAAVPIDYKSASTIGSNKAAINAAATALGCVPSSE